MLPMQVMMKRLFAVFCVLVLAGCVSSGNGGNPWSGQNAQAQQAPSSLGPPAQPQQLPAGIWQSPEQQYQQQQAQAQTQQPYSNGGYMPPYQDQTPAGDFGVTIGGNGATTGGAQPGAAPTVPGMAAPVAATPALPPVKVALLLPLSGKSGDLGQAMLQAAQLALFDMGYNAFELMPRDTGDTPAGAQKAAQSAIDAGAQLILGPLFASSTRAVQPVVRSHNINMVTFSTDWTLADNNTFVMGFLPFVQVQRIAEFAARRGARNVGIFAPNTDYGNAVIGAYNSVAHRAGLSSADVVRFPPDQADLSPLIRDFSRYEQRVESFDREIKPLEEALKKSPNDAAAASRLQSLKQRKAETPPPFDAVMVPVGGEQARSIASMLNFYDLDQKQVMRLGTGLWDDPGLATEPALQGAFFAASSPDLRASFETNYRLTYGMSPPRLATLAYDATALAAVLARNGYQSAGRPAFDRNALTNPNGFAGIDGIFRFRPDGLIERGLAVLQYKDSHIAVVDPAPTTFQQWTGQ